MTEFRKRFALPIYPIGHELAIPCRIAGRQLRVALVGAGALGSEIARRLIGQGLRDVLVIDPDRIEAHNVPLSRMFRHLYIGRGKAEVLAEAAGALGWQAVPAEVADVGLGLLRECDLLVSATDSALSRVETAFAAGSLRLPMLDAGVQPHGIAEARVSSFAPGAACYLCGFSEARRAELLGFALSASLGCRLPDSGSAASPMTGTPAAVDAAAEALVALLLDPRGPASTSFAQRLLPDGVESIELTRSPSCPWHALPPPGELFALPDDRPVCELLAPGDVLELPWPVCLRARCRACGAQAEPMLRAARVRRTLPCPGCGAVNTLEPLAIAATLRRTDPAAALRLQQLGLAGRQLFHVRRALSASA